LEPGDIDKEGDDEMGGCDWADAQYDSMVSMPSKMNQSSISEANEALTEYDKKVDEDIDASDLVNDLGVQITLHINNCECF
jgi:hypothetical protein